MVLEWVLGLDLELGQGWVPESGRESVLVWVLGLDQGLGLGLVQALVQEWVQG